MAAQVTYKIVVKSVTRNVNERFQPTRSINEPFSVITDLDQYADDIEPMLSLIWSYVENQRLNVQSEVSCNYSITLENTTAGSPPAGAWVQAKQHFDGTLSSGNLTDIDKLRDQLLNRTTVVKTLAKY